MQRRITDQQLGKHQMRRRRSDVDADAGKVRVRPHRAVVLMAMMFVSRDRHDSAISYS